LGSRGWYRRAGAATSAAGIFLAVFAVLSAVDFVMGLLAVASTGLFDIHNGLQNAAQLRPLYVRKA
jgi:hypothetical protein